MIFLKRIVFEDIHELSIEMIHEALNFTDCVSAVCHYEVASALLSEIIQSEIPIGQIDIRDYDLSGYDKEYIVTIMDGNVYCNPAYGMKKDGYTRDGYLGSYADVAYIHQDCNSKLLKDFECDKMYEFVIEELDDVDDKYECYGDCSNLEDDDIVTHHSNSVTVSRDRNGNPTGFTKSWSRDDGCGVMQYSSYSYYCSDEDKLRSLAHDLDIEL